MSLFDRDRYGCYGCQRVVPRNSISADFCNPCSLAYDLAALLARIFKIQYRL